MEYARAGTGQAKAWQKCIAARWLDRFDLSHAIAYCFKFARGLEGTRAHAHAHSIIYLTIFIFYPFLPPTVP